MKLKFDTKNDHIRSVMQDTFLIDIETSLINSRVFRPGTQFVGANQTSSTTKLLTVAGGTLFDLYTKGEDGMFGFGNHMSPTFKNDPLDDTYVLRRLWDILDKARCIVAHSASFDVGWINGRFLELGWPLPSKYSVVCTLRGLTKYNLTSKKLDQLSKTILGTRKLPTTFELWDRCSDGEVTAFEEMMEYNYGDIANTLFKLYMRTAQYYPDFCVDMADYTNNIPQCKVSGEELVELDQLYTDRKTGCKYRVFFNETLGIYYRDRYQHTSKKAGRGFVRHLR